MEYGLNANFYRIDDNFNKLFTSYAGCNIPDCFHSHHSCSEAAKDSKPVYVRVPCFSFLRNLRQLTYPKLSIFECGAEQRFDLHNNFWLDVLTARVYASRTRVLFTTNLSWGLLGLVRLIKICKKLNTWSLSIQAKLSKIWKQRQIVQKSLQKFRKLLNFRNVNHSIENSKKNPRAKLNGKNTSGKKNRKLVYLVWLSSFLEILETVVPFATGSYGKLKPDVLGEWK